MWTLPSGAEAAKCSWFTAAGAQRPDVASPRLGFRPDPSTGSRQIKPVMSMFDGTSAPATIEAIRQAVWPPRE